MHFVWDELDVEIVVERLREERGALRGDFSPQSVSGTGWLPTQTIDLISGESAKRYANVLGNRIMDGESWFDMITQAQRLARERYRSGEPSVVLRDVDWSSKSRFAVFPLVESGVRSMLFGDGGVSKSLHSLAIAVSVATGEAIIPGTKVHETGPVLYLDWEDEAATHAERLAAICAGVGIEVPANIIYMRRSGSLHESTREIRREIAKQGAILAIVDSVGAACGGDPEKAADVIRAFDAMRSLGVSILALHHVTKDQKDRTKPFGSIYSPNLSRLTWRLDGERGKNEIYVRAQSHKGNNNGDLAPLGHRVGFEVDDDGRLLSVEFTTTSANRVPPVSGGGNGLRNKIASALKASPLTVKEISTEIESGEQTVRTQLSRHKDWFIHLEDGRWALKAEDHLSKPNQGKPVLNHGLEQTKPPPPPIGRGLEPGLHESEEELPW